MTLSVNDIGRVSGAYRSQNRIAQMNRQNPVRTVQGQVDRVTISEKARLEESKLQNHPIPASTMDREPPIAPPTSVPLDPNS